MKTLLISFLGLFITFHSTFSQKPIVIKEDTIAFGNGSFPGFEVYIPEVNFQSTQKNWIKVLKRGTKSEPVMNNDEISIFGANIKEFSNTPVNIYSKFSDVDTAVKMMVIVELAKDKYLGRGTGENNSVKGKNYLKKFAKEQYGELASEELRDEQKKLKDLTKDHKSLQKDKDQLQKEIQANKKNISNEKQTIIIKNNEVLTLSNEIVMQSSLLTSMSKGELKDQKEDQIKDLEKSKKKAMNEIESSENKINKANSRIIDANIEIPKNESKQREMKAAIENQELVVKKFQNKLNTIKKF